ncbi:MAG: hypothetical protein N2C14_22715, partial [Planctomycetales bacterium]
MNQRAGWMFTGALFTGALFAGAVLTATPAVGQTSYPMLMDLHPVAIQAGTKAEATVSSRYDLNGTYRVFVDGKGVTAKAIPNKPSEDKDKKPAAATTLKIEFEAAADAALGAREFRVATPRGISTVGQLVVVRDPVAVEEG